MPQINVTGFYIFTNLGRHTSEGAFTSGGIWCIFLNLTYQAKLEK